MAVTTPVNSGYTIINGSTTGSNGSKVNTWLEYKVLSQSIELNQSTVRVILYSQATFDSGTEHTSTRQYGYVKIGSDQQSYTMTGGYDFGNKKLNKFADHTFTVSHSANGTKTVAMSGAWSDSGWSTFISGGSASASVTLPTIPQYASCTISNTSKTETSAVIKWTTDQTVDHVWYSTNGGSSYTDGGSVNATTGTINLSGLSVDTTYSVKVKVRNKSSQLQSESSALSVKTYNYPYATTMPDFIIGDKVTIQFQNPLGREFTFTVKVGNNTITNTWTISGTSYSGLNGSSTVTQLYATIPNTTSATYSIVCTYDGHTVTKSGGTVSVNANICVPSVSAVTYADVNSSVTSITGDSSKIVQGKSTVRYTVTGATGRQFASISSVTVDVFNASYTLSQSGSDYIGGNASIGSASDVVAVATITDSRGFSVQTSVTVDMVEYKIPSAILSIARHNNYYSETDITVDADYVSIGNNAITIQYRTKKTSSSTYGSWGNLSDNVTSTVSLDNTSAWDIQIKLTDSFGGSATYNTSISRGMPIVYFDRLRESVGINCFPQENQSLEVDGYNLLNSLVYKGVLDSTVDIDDMHGAEYTGYYAIRSSMPTNYPNSGWTWCYFIVLSNGEVSQQYVFRPSTGFIARHWAGNPPHWYVWHYITTTHFAIGDTFTFNVSFPLNGFITSSTTGVRLALYLPKSASQVPVVKVTECSGTLRGISGYLNSDSSNHDFISDSTNYSVVATKVKDNLVTLQINKTSAYTNVTNNTPVSFYPNKLTLSFEDNS